MDPEAIKNSLQEEIIKQQFPELAGVEPQVESGPSETRLRDLRRRRAVVTGDDISALPLEYRFVWQAREDEALPFDKTVVIVTDEKGEPQHIIESK